ncbi:RrF2 family transcriptional regulator [Janibacter terrae]|uniref:RrF2 family transcriptional regulator n=1 Tax=Janibacter terrae TaxID=103817 RepID=UPI0008315DDF|nr:Rrf2 family transcriptional regulator [Janibacter terrae]
MRLEVTRRAELAVQAVGLLAPAGTRLKAPELAEALGATPGFVAQVVGPLVKAGWVRSTPGPTGGYSLTDDASGVSVLEVIEAIDGPTTTGRCVAEDRACTLGRTCVLHEAWSRARTTLTDILAATPATAPHP